jgi:hypothetical protein
MDEIFSPITQVEKDVLSRLFEGVGHVFEPVERYGWCADTTHVVTAVVLQHVDTPARETLSILLFVIQ